MKTYFTQIYQKAKLENKSFKDKCIQFFYKKIHNLMNLLCYGTFLSSMATLIVEFFSPQPLSLVSIILFLCAFFTIFYLLFSILAIYIKYIESHQKEKFENNILNLLKEKENDSELNEILVKMALIKKFKLTQKDILDPIVLKNVLLEINQKMVNIFTLEEAKKLIAKPHLLNEYMNINHELLNLSVSDLQLKIKTKIANDIVQHEKDIKEKENFVKEYSTINLTHKIFQTNKNLTANL